MRFSRAVKQSSLLSLSLNYIVHSMGGILKVINISSPSIAALCCGYEKMNNEMRVRTEHDRDAEVYTLAQLAKQTEQRNFVKAKGLCCPTQNTMQCRRSKRTFPPHDLQTDKPFIHFRIGFVQQRYLLPQKQPTHSPRSRTAE
jgi:hypothetical protein